MPTRAALALFVSLASLTTAHAQDLVADKVLEVELKAGDPLLEGHGPSRTFEYDVTFDGTLHIWAASKDFDPLLRITDAAGELLAENDDSGGGTTAYIALSASRNELPIITVASADAGASGKLTLHAHEAPRNAGTEFSIQRTLIGESNAARKAGDYETARAMALEAVTDLLERPESERDDAWLELLDSAGLAAYDAQDSRAADSAWRLVLEIRSRRLPDEHPHLQAARGNLAATMHMQGDLAGARALFEKVLEVNSRTLPDEHPDLQMARLNLAVTIKELGDLAGARALEEKVLEVRSRTLPDEHPDLQKARLNLAVTIKELGDLAGARALEDKVLEVRSRRLPDEHPELQKARGNLAATMHMQGDLAGARALFEKVLEVNSRTLPDEHPDLQMARLNLAVTIKELGDLAGARALQEKVLGVRSRTLPDEHPDLQTARGNLAITIKELGDLPGARALLEKVLDVNSRTLPDEHPGLQRARLNLAATMLGLGDLAGARAMFEKVLDVNSRTLPDEHPALQLARGNLAATIKMQGDLAGARTLQEKVLEVDSRTLPDEHPDLQLARGNLAVTIAAEHARASGREGERHREREGGREQCLDLIAARCRSQTSAARAALLEASPREAEARCQSLGEGLDYSLSLAQGLGVFAPSPELEAPCFVLSETTRGAALASASLMRISASSPRYSTLRSELMTQSGELAALAQRGTTNEEFRQALARRESIERELMALAKELAGGAASGLELDPDALAAKLGVQEALVAYRRYKRTGLTVIEGGNELESAAPVESAVESLCAFVLRRRDDPGGRSRSLFTLVDLGPIEPIEEAVRTWRSAIGAGLERGVGVAADQTDVARTRGEALRALVLDPLRDSIGDAKHLTLVLDDVLHLVPIDALPMESSGSEEPAVVGERWRLDTRCTTTELLGGSAPPSAGALVALGGASFNSEPLSPEAADVAKVEEPAAAPLEVASILRGGAWERGFGPLTYTGLEAREIAALFDEVVGDDARSVVLEKRKASRAALDALAPKARWLHVATHGWFAPESIRSWSDPESIDAKSGLVLRQSGEEQVKGMSPMLLCGLALAGANLPENQVGRAPGLVTADEIASLDLTGCELAVLSACDTNVGERRAGQGVASLQRALQMAGARSVITSLWKVPDEATRELMVDFYRRIWVEKKPKWQALWEAKMKLRNAKDESGNPKYSTRDWAAWVLTGEPR